MKIEAKKIKEKLSKILKRFWQNLFLVLALLLLLDLILGGIFFWQYCFRTQEEKVPYFVKPLKINQALMEKVSEEWTKRESIFQEALEKEYPDPFRGIGLEKID